MDDDIKKKIVEMAAKVDAMYVAQERMQKRAQWTLHVMIALIVLPLLGLLLAIPSFLSTYQELGGLL